MWSNDFCCRYVERCIAQIRCIGASVVFRKSKLHVSDTKLFVLWFFEARSTIAKMTCFVGQDILLACNEIKGVYLRDICFDFFAIGSNILDRSSSHASGNTAEIFESTHTIEEC